jgi:SAM-dependent methyltransferase
MRSPPIEAVRDELAPMLHERAVERVPETEARPLAGVLCPLCASPGPRPLYTIEGSGSCLVACSGCGLGWLEPLPDAAQVDSFYPAEYYGGPGRKFMPLVETAVRAVGARHVRFLSAGLPPGARVLDVGCGRGVLMGALADRGFEVHGFEISAAAADGTDPRAEVRVAPDLVAAGYPAGLFDQVIVWHVLEHLRDPRGTLREVRRILRPGGRLVVAVPNFSSVQARWAGPAWFHLDPPRHLYHFPLGALRRLLDEAGFAVRSEHHFSLRQNPFGWVQSALNRWPRLPRNGLYTLLHRRGAGQPVPFGAGTRRLLWLALVLGMPVALGLSVLEAVFRSGATVHLVAQTRG